MTATDKLKPCPFCGGKARIMHLTSVSGIETHSMVECRSCHIKTDYYVYEFSERNVIKVWNRRTNLGADEYAIERNVDGSYKCPKCGCVVDYDVNGDDERVITMDDYVIPFNFCPKCGAEVVDE